MLFIIKNRDNDRIHGISILEFSIESCIAKDIFQVQTKSCNYYFYCPANELVDLLKGGVVEVYSRELDARAAAEDWFSHRGIKYIIDTVKVSHMQSMESVIPPTLLNLIMQASLSEAGFDKLKAEFNKETVASSLKFALGDLFETLTNSSLGTDLSNQFK